MRFADVTSLSIPEGDVQRIAVNGVTLWELPSSGGLPAGYTLCEYLQLDGNQYVDTGILGNRNKKIEIVFTRETSSKLYLFGAASSNNKATVTAYLGGYWRFGAKYTTPSIAESKKHTAVIADTGIDLNGTNVRFNGTGADFTTPYSIVVGTAHLSTGEINTTRHIGKIYSFKMWDNETLVCEYMPCINQDGVYGFWDNVARKFRASEGTAAFTGG